LCHFGVLAQQGGWFQSLIQHAVIGIGAGRQWQVPRAIIFPMVIILGSEPTQNWRLQGFCINPKAWWYHRRVWRDIGIVQFLVVQKEIPQVIKPLRIYRHCSHAEPQPTTLISTPIKTIIIELFRRRPLKQHLRKSPLHDGWIWLPTNKKDAIIRWIDGTKTPIIIVEHNETIQTKKRLIIDYVRDMLCRVVWWQSFISR